jgi:hypothetical protein
MSSYLKHVKGVTYTKITLMQLKVYNSLTSYIVDQCNSLKKKNIKTITIKKVYASIHISTNKTNKTQFALLNIRLNNKLDSNAVKKHI